MKRIIVLLLALVFAVNSFAGTVYYVDASGGNDSNNGTTTGTPFLTLAKCVTVAAAGDTFNLKGTFRESADFRDKGNNITIQQWAGQTAAWIRGDTVLSSFTIDGTSNNYNATVASGLTIATVTVNWDSQVNSQGQHYGHLTKASSKANCQATNDSWYYSGTELNVRIGANLNPSGYTVTYVGAASGKNGLDVGSNGVTPGVGYLVKNITFALWSYSAAGTGYGLRLFSTQNSLADGNTYYDCGYHSQGIVNYNGIPVRNVWEKNSSAYGIVAGGDSHYVVYADTGGCDSDSGFENCFALTRPFLGRDGNPIHNGASATMIGFACHTGNGAVSYNIKNFIVKDCLVVMGTTHASTTNRMIAFRTAGVADPGNPLDWRTYGAKFIRADVQSGVSCLTKSHAAFVYCNWDFSLAGSTGAASDSNGGAIGDNASADRAQSILFYGCDIRADLNTGSGSHGCMFYVRGNTALGASGRCTIRFIGCSVLNTSTNSTDAKVRAIFDHSTDNTCASGIYARQSIFGHAIPTGTNLNNFTWNNGGITLPDKFNIKDCWIINVASTRYSSHTSYDQDTEWFNASTGIDPTGLYGTVSPFRSQFGVGGLQLNGYGRSTKKFLSPNIIEGINRRQYGGSHNYGAYQYGKEAAVVPPL